MQKVVSFPARARPGSVASDGMRRSGTEPRVSDRIGVLILGGTVEAQSIAERLVARGDVRVVTSLAGREEGSSVPVESDVRIGGFADAGALADFVRERCVGLVVDAAEPFAFTLRQQAADVARLTGVNRVVFERPPFPEAEEDNWIHVQSCAEAADLLPGFARRVLLDLPSGDLDSFTRLQDLWFLLRPAEREPQDVPLASYERAASRAVSTEQEEALLRQHRLDMLLTRENGSDANARLLPAARALSLPVMLLERPALPPSDVVHSVDDVLAWVQARLDENPDIARRIIG